MAGLIGNGAADRAGVGVIGFTGSAAKSRAALKPLASAQLLTHSKSSPGLTVAVGTPRFCVMTLKSLNAGIDV
jgi:hypothetical protein